ncbi:MAG: sulfotransferase, partial [Gammaproteobacteria bacterium]
SEGNSKRRMQEVYDPVETEVVNDMIIDVFSKGLLEKNADAGNADPSPIFIIGLPRSGSTLIEQILASHSLVEGTSELPYVTRITKSLNRNRADGINYPKAVAELYDRHFVAMGQDYINFCQMHRTEGKQHFIDKNPNNFPAVGFIHLTLPNAKIIDARRHPMDACFSCYRQLFAKGQPFTYDLTDIGEYYLQYRRMMDYWHEVLPGRVLTVQYEEVVTDFENQVRRLLEYCGLPFEEGCLNYYDTDRPVRTASSEQVRQPIYTQSLGRWRYYEQHLDELKEILDPLLPRYEQYQGIGPDD